MDIVMPCGCCLQVFPCGHDFCPGCARRLFDEFKGVCPVCRGARVKQSQVFRVAVQGRNGIARPSRVHADPDLAKVSFLPQT